MSMSKKVCIGLVQALGAAQASTYGAASKLAEALFSGELEVKTLDTSLLETYPEDQAKARQAVEQAIRVQLSRITGQPMKDAEGKVIKDEKGNITLNCAKMTISRRNKEKDDKTLKYEPAKSLAPTVQGATATAKTPETVVEAAKLLADAPGAQYSTEWHGALLESSKKLLATASPSQAIQFGVSMLAILKAAGAVAVDAEVIVVTTEKPAKPHKGKGKGAVHSEAH